MWLVRQPQDVLDTRALDWSEEDGMGMDGESDGEHFSEDGGEDDEGALAWGMGGTVMSAISEGSEKDGEGSE